jgi:hypothetical protein
MEAQEENVTIILIFIAQPHDLSTFCFSFSMQNNYVTLFAE